MDVSSRFRALLARRLLRVAGVVAIAPLLPLACSDDETSDASGGTGASGGSSSSTAGPAGSTASTGGPSGSTASTGGGGGVGGDGGMAASVGPGGAGGMAASVGAGGAGGMASSVGSGGAGGDGGTMSVGTTGAAGGPSASATVGVGGQGGGVIFLCPPEQACFPWSAGPCPMGSAALAYFMDDCFDGCMPEAVLSAPMFDGQQCCYQTGQMICGVIGRPFLVGGEARRASTRTGGSAGGWTDAAAPDVAGLDEATRAELSRQWAADAQLEHASVAAFARFSMELLAVGAPADLVTAAHEAALDEVRHARACFSLASTYRGETIAPSSFPFGGSVALAQDLVSIAVSAAREGCIGETLAALVAAEQLARATDPVVRAVLEGIAEDEARHAELAWRAVGWAIRAGGDAVRAAVCGVFEEAARELASGGPVGGAARVPRLEAHGRLDDAAVAEVRLRGLADVVLPCGRAVTARPTATTTSVSA